MFEVHYAVAIAAVVLTAFAHLMLKTGAASAAGQHPIRLWLNGRTLSGYALMLAVTLMNLFAYKVVPIRANVVLSPMVLFLVTMLAVILLGERLTRRQTIGCALIIAGIAVFNV